MCCRSPPASVVELTLCASLLEATPASIDCCTHSAFAVDHSLHRHLGSIVELAVELFLLHLLWDLMLRLHLSRRSGRLLPGGEPDLNCAAVNLVNDWQVSTFDNDACTARPCLCVRRLLIISSATEYTSADMKVPIQAARSVPKRLARQQYTCSVEIAYTTAALRRVYRYVYYLSL
jgi:hypothetical protein